MINFLFLFYCEMYWSVKYKCMALKNTYNVNNYESSSG